MKAGKQCVVLAITVPQIAAAIKELRGNLKAGRERRQKACPAPAVPNCDFFFPVFPLNCQKIKKISDL
ncbi:MAG: hypothetical protein LPJ92_06045 [Rhodobacterales bacterium]|nr:hypothetical protein [Rhodobacterales bacterium]MDX5389883.1 hypothetical protein [Rhodobacterales bacterium]MDX5489574.1 hypothetical protein [Rhodobacterales bacterium]